jgi:hydrophobic/amphiphilic exporter-1 (mainly G- bacteria), HAE1 family
MEQNMILSKFSIKRPVAMTALIIVLILAGFNSYRRIGLNNMPEIDAPFVTITTVYPGASPAEIEVDIAKKIEDAVSNIDGLKHLNSTCMENICITSLEFQLSVDSDVAAADVRDKLSLILNDLPDGAELPKTVKFDVNAKPVVTLLLSGDLPVDKLYDYADEELADRLSAIAGVADVQVRGGEELELHVTIDKNRLTAAGLNTAMILKQLALNNIKIPSGTIKTGQSEASVTFDAEFKNFAEIGALELGAGKNGKIYLQDIAEIKMISKEKRTQAFYNGKPAVNIKIIKKGEVNAVRVVERIRRTVNELRNSHSIPGGMKLVWFTDDGEFIQASVSDAWSSIFIGIVLTALILFIFLHELRSTLIVALTMPISIIITFAAMRYFNYTFNNSTLLALGTSVGVLVTNSIVVVENIIKKLHAGFSPAVAAADGTGEVALPVFASAMTNVVVFVPIAMMSTLVGRYFIPFAVTITSATLVSLFVSFTMTAMLSSKLLRSKMPEHKALMKWYVTHWNRFYQWLDDVYAHSLQRCSKYPWLILTGIALLFFFTLAVIAPRVGMAFFPESDRGEFIVKLEYPSYYNIDANIKRTLALEEKLHNLPEVRSTSVLIGKVQGILGQVSEGVHLAEVVLTTSGKNERTLDMDAMREMIRNSMKHETDVIVTVNVPGMVAGASSDIQLEIAGNNLPELEQLGRTASVLAVKSGKMSDVDTSIRAGKPEVKIIPKRSILHDMKLPAELLGRIFRSNIEGVKVGTYKIGARSYDIRVELKQESGIKQLNEFTLMSQKGRPLSIESVATIKNSTMPIQISRAEKKRIIKIFANPAPGVALGDAVAALTREVKTILPQGFSMRFGGKVEKMQEAQFDFLEAIIIASLLTYLLIAAILESWIQPFMILLTIPLALIGLFFALWIAGMPLSMMGLLGAVMLIGIVVNNAILIIDNVIILRAKGIPPKAAMLESAKEKFRPIVMTSIAAIIGISPMAFGSGLGSEMRSSCGIGVIGGLVSSTVLSLYVIPLIYILFVKDKKNKISK